MDPSNMEQAARRVIDFLGTPVRYHGDKTTTVHIIPNTDPTGMHKGFAYKDSGILPGTVLNSGLAQFFVAVVRDRSTHLELTLVGGLICQPECVDTTSTK